MAASGSVPSRRSPAGRLVAAAILSASAALGPVGGAAATEVAADPQQLVAALAQATLETAQAVAVERVALDVDLAKVVLESGWLIPATPLADRAVEIVFVGSGRLILEPPDDVEAGQLELYTGENRVDRPFEAAAFVVASDAASDALLRRRGAATADAAKLERAASLWRRWRESPERRALGVDATLLADALGEAVYAGAFVAWMHHGEELPFVFQVDPVAEEPVGLGRFEPLDADERERRKIARALRSEQRSGRGLGLALEDFGRWEQWLSAPLGTLQDKPWPRQTLFEPSRYVLEAELSGRGDLTLAGRARLVVQARAAGHRIVVATLHPDLVVSSVRDVRGAPLAFHRAGTQLAIVLAAAPAPGDDTTIEVLYAGRFLDKAGRSLYALRDTLGWYPRVGAVDRATYDVTLSWPARLEVVASGERAGGGERPDGTRWERRTIDRPSFGFSFEAGRFEVARLSVPRPGQEAVAVEVYFDAESEDLPKAVRQEIQDAATDALAYFGEVFAPYREPTLRIVTVPRWSSQGLPGFVTLSSFAMSDVDGIWRLLLGMSDRRTTVAHEIAHQWWGNRIGWKSYRDQWISEAMASYAALLWARNRLPPAERPILGPTFGWKRDLLATLEDGRPVESLGPVTLGMRLLAGKDPSAYDAIVYKKGAVVLDMLSRYWSEADFLRILKWIVEHASDRAVATSELTEMIERLTGIELDGFARRFIFGTGLPEVQFRYELGARRGDKWPVRIRAAQVAPFRFVYAIAAGADGRLAVRRERRAQMEIDDTGFVLPFQIPVDAPWPADAGPPPKPKKGEPPPRPHLEGRLVIRGAESVIDLELDHRPLGVELDSRGEVFARVFDLERAPKRAALRAALAAAATNDLARARAGFEEVFRAKVRLPAEYGRSEDEETLAGEGRELDARARLSLARLALDAGDATLASRELELAEKGLDRAQRSALEGERALLEARLDLAQGAAAAAFKRLRRAVLKQRQLDDVESWLWLAIAAEASGETATLKRAVEVTTRRGADLGPLRASP